MTLKASFTTIRYYTSADPYHFTVDNRPLTDLKAGLDFLADTMDAGFTTINLSVTGSIIFTDATLIRDSANVLAQRNGVNAQTLRIYNTFTDATNYERGTTSWISNSYVLRTENSGTGTARDLVLGTSGTNRWKLLGATGHLLVAAGDNLLDIGDVGATGRPRTAYLATGLRIGTWTTGNGLIGIVSGTDGPSNGIQVGGIDGATGSFRIGYATSDTGAQQTYLKFSKLNAAASRSGKIEAFVSGSNTDTGDKVLEISAAGITNVNWIKIQPNTTGLGPTISSDGETNVDLNIAAKGTGIVKSASAIQSVNGSTTTVAYGFTSQANTGMYRFGANQLAFANNGNILAWGGQSLASRLATTSFGLGTAPGSAEDVILERDAANILALRNSTTAQILRIYNTFTDASNFERVGINWTTNVASIHTNQAGTGTARELQVGTLGSAVLTLVTNNTSRWQIGASTGHILAVTDNSFDIGQPGATRPRSVYLSARAVLGDINVTYSASMTIDVSTGNEFTITANNGTAFTINAPTNPTSGQRITITLRNTSGGSLGTATWNAVFKMATWTNPANANSRSIEFKYDGTNWIERQRTASDIPN